MKTKCKENAKKKRREGMVGREVKERHGGGGGGGGGRERKRERVTNWNSWYNSRCSQYGGDSWRCG